MGTQPWIRMRVSAIALIAAAALLSSCSVYDPSLLQGGGMDGSTSDGATDANLPDAPPDSSDNDSGDEGCVPGTEEFCPLICPETCNAIDDDCDGRVDEMPSTLCDLANTVSECVDGACLVVGCTGVGADCDGRSSNGCEARLDSTDNCGLCGMTCSIPGADVRCVQATCIFEACLPGFGNCDGNPGNGCELRVDTLAHCGGCRVACGTVEHGQPGCNDGLCGIAECDSGFSDCDGDVRNGCETALDTLNSCGACDTRCEFESASSACASGTCVLESCAGGYANCDDVAQNGCEVSLADDVNNCGTCGRACDASGSGGNFECVNGECVVTTCPAGLADCDSDANNGCETSVRTLTDCGGCGMACNFTNANGDCSSGTCAFDACLPGFGDCDGNTNNGCEVSLATDTDCGICGRACDVSGGRMCSGGQCSLVSCPPGLADCDDDGIDCEQSLSTLASCGACGTRCGDAQGRLPNATASCSSGACAIGTCSANFSDCDASAQNGCEASLRTTANCGACGRACSLANASVTCSTGTCAIDTCNTGFANCDGDASNGCETGTNSNSNCGGCNVTCAQANATTTCGSGTCQRVSCNAGYGDCDGNPSNGCETQLNSLTHCGACGNTCSLANGTQTCDTGVCTLTGCNQGYGNCDFVASNGCETPLNTTQNCNACGSLCDYTNAAETCAAGNCTLTACNSGFGNCDANEANGCEQALTNNTHCGGCNISCSRTNAATSCGSGTCTLGACNAGWGNCDGNAANGCETQLTSDTHCGGCNAACGVNDARTCSGGICSLSSCPSGSADCDNDGTTCEQPLNTSAHCGGCNVACTRPNASASCSTGTCTLGMCSGGFGNCDGNASNGCEQSLNTNAHCGACGVTCTHDNAASSCSTGTCALGACDPGWSNCDGNAANGCEGSGADSDNDGFPDCLDGCPFDPNKQVAGVCGCGTADSNSDGDGALDCLDGCPFDASTTAHCLRKRITILAGTVTSNLTDFPVLVRFVDPALSAARPDGFDLWFSLDGGPTALAFEIERFVQSAGELVAWVKLPLIAAGSDTTFYLRYGDGSGTNKSNAASVWSNGFRAVYHMNYGGGAGTQNDSTSNANHAPPDSYTGGGCASTAGRPADQPTGMIGKALTFGANPCNRLLANDSNSLDITTALTISAWTRVTGSNSAGHLAVVSKRIRTNETANYQTHLWSDRNMGFMWGTGTMWPPVYNSSPAAIPALNTWAYTVWTVQGSPLAMRTYLNGVRINSTDQNLSSNVGGSYPVGRQLQLNANTQPLFIGGLDQETDAPFVGDLDEVRIAATSRSPAWIAAEYNNQRAGSTFLTIVEE